MGKAVWPILLARPVCQQSVVVFELSCPHILYTLHTHRESEKLTDEEGGEAVGCRVGWRRLGRGENGTEGENGVERGRRRMG